jgi:CRISPR-associated endonuclease/helicase Cas3
VVRQRIHATKALHRLDGHDVPAKPTAAWLRALADRVVAEHRPGSLTLVLVNRVARAQALFEALRERATHPVALVHSRFRAPDRRAAEAVLHAEGDRIVVATQAIEAGVDVSAQTLFTELAPWSSLVQRIGRCNRYGESVDARVFWIDLDLDPKSGDLALPYEAGDLVTARGVLAGLTDVGPEALRQVTVESAPPVRPVIRRRDFLELFDTTPDLSGNDLDVSRWIRDGEDTDVQVFWRVVGDGDPPADLPAPSREERCAVGIGAFNGFLSKRGKKAARAWTFGALSGAWEPARRVRPGQTVLLSAESGGYDPALGWTGEPSRDVPTVVSGATEPERPMDADWRTAIGRWVRLEVHLEDVATSADALCRDLGLDERERAAVVRAARWHDLGKAHPVFQRMLAAPGENDPSLAPPASEALWAKSSHNKGRAERRHFRHELASALAFLQAHPGAEDAALTAFLIAAHHGKVRLSIRSLDGEKTPPGGDVLFARGVWQGDELPEVDLGPEGRVAPTRLDLTPMQMGEGSWLEQMLALRDAPDLGPLRLALLETLVRIADARASALEAQGRTP